MRKQSLLVFFSCVLLVATVAQFSTKCNAQSSSIRITHEEYGWTDDMKRLGITTQDTGVIFKITIFNEGQLPLRIGYSPSTVYPNPFVEMTSLYISINLVSTDTQPHYDDTKKIVFDSDNPLYLPPKESYSRMVQFDHYGLPLPIGSYTAKLEYSPYALSYGSEGTPIEPYPFTFRVASSDTLQNAIRQDSGAFIQIGSINITLFEFGGSITVFSLGLLAVYFWKRKKHD